MRAALLCTSLVAFTLAVTVPVTGAAAAAPTLKGSINGIELAPQSLVGAAVFVFEYQGLVNGRQRSGWGWIAVNHQDLPTTEDASSLIVGGTGAIYIGLQPFSIDIHGGSLTLTNENDPAVFDDDFGVSISFSVSNLFGQHRDHEFEGVLSHQPLIPTIVGDVSPSGP